MISNVSNYNASCTIAATDKKAEVNDEFIKYLTDKFSNDEVRDVHQSRNRQALSRVGDTQALFGVESVNNEVQLTDIQESMEQDLQSIQYMLDLALNEAGINKNPSFNINSSESGILYIDSEHPDKESIEKILNENPNIRETYKRVSMNSSLIASCKRQKVFNTAYEIDPISAVRKFDYLFENNPCDVFTIFVSEDCYRPNLNSYKEDNSWESLVDFDF